MKSEGLSEHSDGKLWDLVRQNDRVAFEEIYRRYWSKIYYAAYKVLKEQEISSDLTQEVFTQLWLKREATEISSISSYLYGMIRNQVFKSLRDGKIAQFHLDRIHQITFVNQTEETVNLHQLQEIYEASLATLPARCREVFHLSRNEHMSVKEIALQMEISPKTVENQITKALKLLRVAFREVVMLGLLFFS
ncbi:RNA polymerase sigma-70 factor [Catalinimonas niigatensis]|uniref:RNA polymerase sigma-70 factor n=1 Tax=Catalinimonas niigatensis TaxID=1397264 RepID=UPI0026666613|nr:RNA polymerase sigma-70 factor [Catalinimonas niigatensis]WPP50771.1 RNA polymerase sigma-70 factor [Catalinimonas niigatensis]